MSSPNSLENHAESERDRFYQQYGKAMAAWADLEIAMCDWFRRAICPDGQRQFVNADSIFYSARSFNGRVDMLKAAIKGSLLTETEKALVRKVIRRACDYNSFRSKLAHRSAIESRGFGPGKDGLFLREGDDTAGRGEHLPSISLEHLNNATEHIDALHWITLLAGMHGGLSIEKALRLIDRLPKEAHLPADNHLLEEIYEPLS